jgi:voltage-gated potassium channel Kch
LHIIRIFSHKINGIKTYAQLYFSVVTIATVGYGDILPITLLQKAVVISEILIGYLMGGLLVAILAKRVIG